MTNCCLVGLSGKVAVLAPLLLMTLFCVHYESAEGVLVQTPSNTTVIANNSTFFNCSKLNNKSDELTWHHYTVDGKAEGVYEDGKIRDIYRGRFDIEKNLTSGAFNLLVQRPETADAGRYECVEDPLEKDTGASAELTILDSNLVCESDNYLNEIIGPTECDKPIAPDQLQLLCSVTYSGNIPPQMQWRKAKHALESMGIPNCGVRGNRVMCNATVKANLNMDGSVYICQIIAAQQYNCSLKVNKTIYAFSDNSVRAVTTTEEVLCSANTSMDLPCSYKWYKDNTTLPFGQTLKPSNPGLYRCEAECTIRSDTCAFTAMVINASAPGNGKLLWLLVLLIIPLAFVAGLVYYNREKHWRKPVAVPGPPPQEMLLMLEESEGKETGEDNAIIKTCTAARYIDKGLNGHLYGPGLYKGKRCVCEEIVFTEDQKTLRNKEGITDVEKICRNGERWRRLTHENLIKIHEVISRPLQAVYIVMEYTAGRSVRKELKKRTEDLPMPVVKDWATQIAKGLKYLHENDIIHKNIKSTQIFITEEIKEPSDISIKTLKIGSINFLDNDSINHGSSTIQEQPYLSPETYRTGIYSKQSDVWSFSVVVWELLTKKLPYENVKGPDKIPKDLEYPTLCPEKLKGILIECRIEEPSDRPTFTTILERLQEWQL